MKPRKKKKAARKDRKIQFGSCISTLANFEKIIEKTGQIVEEEIFSSQHFFKKHCVTALGSDQTGAWLCQTITDQRKMLCIGPWFIPWSLCVTPCSVGVTEYKGFGLISVVVFDYVITRPVGKIIPALKGFLQWWKRVPSSECKMECWLCLDPFYTVESAQIWNADYFCCGHMVCPKCTTAAARLNHCGVCRAVAPPNDGLEDRITSRVKGQKIKILTS